MTSIIPYRILFALGLFVCFHAGFADAAPETEIRDLIRKLGDDDYLVRQRAESRLLRIGIDAFTELRRALHDPDVEIVRRAERLLAQLESTDLSREDETVREMVDLYSAEENTAQKAIYIWTLACPLPFFSYPAGIGFKNGEGFQTLCRIARFDRERPLRVEAVKCLIAVPPLAPSLRRNWHQSLRQRFSDPGDDDLFRLVRDFADLRCEIDERTDRAEQEARQRELQSGTPIEYPVPIRTDESLRRRVADWTDRLADFQSKPENDSILSGSWIDMLLFYAAAELQDAAGLHAERDRTLKALLNIRTETIPGDHPLAPFDPLDYQAFGHHYYAAVMVMECNRLRWAREHFGLIAEQGAVLLRVRSHSMLAGIEHLLGDYDAGIRHYDRLLEILGTEEYTQKFGDGPKLDAEYQARRLYFSAQKAADAGDWAQAAQRVDEAIQRDPFEIDAIILRHKIADKLPQSGPAYRDRTQALVDDAVADVERQLREGRIRVPVACNQVAWLLANTDGDFATALALIGVTIKAEPESSVYLDTQAHVFALGGKYDEAVRSQEKAVRYAPEATLFHEALNRFRKRRD